MFENFKLSDLKGAPLSIIIFLSMNGNRAVSAADLAGAEGTGYSDKPIKAGLMKLKELGMVTETRRNRYQLTGKEYQLPLYWDEKVLPFGDSPKNIGETPKLSGDSPNLEKRIAALEAAVFAGKRDAALVEPDVMVPDEIIEGQGQLRSGNFAEKFGFSPNESGDSPMIEISGEWAEDDAVDDVYSWSMEKFGETPESIGETPMDFGDSPKVLINNINNTQEKEVSKYVSNHTYLHNNQSISGDQLTGGEIPGDSPKSFSESEHFEGHGLFHSVTVGGNTEGVGNQTPLAGSDSILATGSDSLTEICNEYLMDPAGIEYSREELMKLIGMKPDPRVLRFILPRATKFDKACAWCRKDFVSAKKSLLTFYKLTGKAFKDLSENDRVSLEMIEEECERVIEQLGKSNIGAAYRKIMQLASVDVPEM